MPKLIFTFDFWTREIVQNDPGRIYLFGDNMVGYGNAGQACIRGLENAVGVPTKWMKPEKDLFTDDDFDEVFPVILGRIQDAVRDGRPIVCHVNIGRGLAKLHESAPRIYAALLVALHDVADGAK